MKLGVTVSSKDRALAGPINHAVDLQLPPPITVVIRREGKEAKEWACIRWLSGESVYTLLLILFGVSLYTPERYVLSEMREKRKEVLPVEALM